MKNKSVKKNLNPVILSAVFTLSLLSVGIVNANEINAEINEEGSRGKTVNYANKEGEVQVLGTVLGEEADIKNQIINFVNQERVKAGLEQLQESQLLNEVANLKAQDMLGNNYFAHTSPTGVDPWFWFDRVGYEYRFAGENLGMDFKTAVAVHQAWMKSELHKENILSPKYTEIGVAVKKGIIDNKETQVAVQSFGNPLGGGTTVEKELQNKNDEVNEDEQEGVKIVQSSLHFWEGEDQDEVLVSAEIEGDAKEVKLAIGKDEYELEQLREGVYVNLIPISEEEARNEEILIKVVDSQDLAVFGKISDKYLADYLIAKDEEIETEDQEIMAMLNSDKQNNILEKVRVWLNQTGIVLLIVGLLIITILNIWILEREEERLLQLKTKT